MRDQNSTKLMERLVWYFGQEEAARIFDSIIIVNGDIADKKLGMSDEQYEKIAALTKEIYHSAADVRHYAEDEDLYMKTNVDGTKNMLELADKAGAAFYHMSTLSVSGNGMKNGYQAIDFTENDYDIGQVWENNIYVKSKFLAEGLVFNALKQGLDAKIFRLGRLMGRMSDGRFQINSDTNAFYLLMKGIMQVGAIPNEFANIKTDVMPVDLAVKEVLALRSGESTVYHIMNFNPPSFLAVLKAAIGDMFVADKETFDKIFREKIPTVDRELVAVIFGKLSEETSRAPSAIISSVITEKHLEKSGFDLPEIPLETVFKNFCKGE
jgi:thioester reductase-like protein